MTLEVTITQVPCSHNRWMDRGRGHDTTRYVWFAWFPVKVLAWRRSDSGKWGDAILWKLGTEVECVPWRHGTCYYEHPYYPKTTKIGA